MIRNLTPIRSQDVDPELRERESIEHPNCLVARCPGGRNLYARTVTELYSLLRQEHIEQSTVLIEHIPEF